jgi:hypothetical protein
MARPVQRLSRKRRSTADTTIQTVQNAIVISNNSIIPMADCKFIFILESPVAFHTLRLRRHRGAVCCSFYRHPITQEKAASAARACAGLYRKRAQHRENSIEAGASATENAMLRFVARVLIARQHDLCGTGGLLCCILGLCVFTPHPRHTEPHRPQRAPSRWGHFFGCHRGDCLPAIAALQWRHARTLPPPISDESLSQRTKHFDVSARRPSLGVHQLGFGASILRL